LDYLDIPFDLLSFEALQNKIPQQLREEVLKVSLQRISFFDFN